MAQQQDYGIHYRPLLITLQAMNVQELIEQASDPFLVLDGLVGAELEGAEAAEPGPRQGFGPAGMLHRPAVPVRSAVLMTEKAGVVATGTDGSPARPPRENAVRACLQPGGLSALLGHAPAVAR